MSPSGPLRVREALSRHPWLGATARTLDTLCLESRLRRYQAGERIARYGESCDAALFILEGTLELGWESEDGRRAVLGYLHAGELANLVPALDSAPIMHDMRAVGRTLLAVIPGRVLGGLIESGDDPVLVRGALSVLGQRIRFLHESIRHQHLLPLNARLARYLLFLAERQGDRSGEGVRIDMKLSQDDLAALLNSSRQSVNRELRVLARQEVVSVGYGGISLLRPDLLAAQAGMLGGDDVRRFISI